MLTICLPFNSFILLLYMFCSFYCMLYSHTPVRGPENNFDLTCLICMTDLCFKENCVNYHLLASISAEILLTYRNR